MKKKTIILRHAGNDGLLASSVAAKLRQAHFGKSVVILASTLPDADATVEALERVFKQKAIRTDFLAGKPHPHDTDKVVSLVDQYSEEVAILVTHMDYAYALPTAVSKHFGFADPVEPRNIKPGKYRTIKTSRHVVVEAAGLEVL